MSDLRPDPEKLLRQLHVEEEDHRRGRLKVFLGYASGVGKSLRMLDEARRREERGEDVVVGAIQPVVSAEVEALLSRMEVIPLRRASGIEAMDMGSILRRRPQVCVVDGLAYDNPPESHHPHRWQDVGQLLESGISVLASVNLQHIQEHHERVEAITGKHVAETVPLDFLRSADEIEVVDAPPETCVEPGAAFGGDDENPRPMGTASRQQRLSELREMALLIVAGVVDVQLAAYLRRHGIEEVWGTHERILVCLKAGTDATRIIESGRRNADRFQGELLAAHVHTPGIPLDHGGLLEANLARARELGAETELLEGDDWVDAILHSAQAHGVTQIFIGHSRQETWWERVFGGAVDRLIQAAEGIDIRVFPQ
jgi:two-component system sensor histidine kinase KdpD